MSHKNWANFIASLECGVVIFLLASVCVSVCRVRPLTLKALTYKLHFRHACTSSEF